MTKVQIAYVHGEDVSHSFHHSMMRLSNSSANPDLYEYLQFSALAGALSIVEARNELMRMFLDETTATHIWWIDTDMGFAPDVVEKLLSANKDVIGGVCYGMAKESPDGLGGYKTKPFIVAYDMAITEATESNPKPIAFFTAKHDLDLSASDPIQVAATGTGCLLVSRYAALVVRHHYGDAWFDQVRLASDKKHVISEDMSFCYRLATVGMPVYIHPKVKTNHQKTVWI